MLMRAYSIACKLAGQRNGFHVEQFFMFELVVHALDRAKNYSTKNAYLIFFFILFNSVTLTVLFL